MLKSLYSLVDFEPVLSKPDVAALRDILQDNDAGLSGYTPDII
ncbi:MAG: hypothetical protein ACKVKA_05630 [Rhodobacterales bacterium]|jgi:hypothetical protein|nr:hypothetical protein [Planktomarina sp.]|tara:strand:- start:323 stop:451 length:129 start_codon:yes stop_codon:yes gene_type:complete